MEYLTNRQSKCRSLAIVNTSGLFLCEKVERVRIALTTCSAVLKSAKRHVQIANKKAVDPRVARFQTTRYTVRSAYVICPNCSSKTISVVVCSFDHFLFFVKCGHTNHWTKYLLLHQWRRVIYVCYNCGQNEIAIRIQIAWFVT